MDRSNRKSTTEDAFTDSESEYAAGSTETDPTDLVTGAALLGEPGIDTETIAIDGPSLESGYVGAYEDRDLDSEDASRIEPVAGYVVGSPYETISSGNGAFETDAPMPQSNGASPTNDGIKQSVSETGDQVKQVAGQIGDQVKQTAGQVVEQAKGQATDFVTTAKQQLTTQLAAQKDQASQRLDNVTGVLRQTGQSFQDKGEAAAGTLVNGLADQIDGASGYLKNRDVDQITRETEVFARQQPGLFLGLAFIAGVAVARFLKSTQSPAY